MDNMCEVLITAIIGVCGTLLGTVLGWLLGKINVGKLHLKFYDFSYYFNYKLKDNENEELSYIENSYIINIYNSSNENKIFSNVKIVFKNKEKQVIQSINVNNLGINKGANEQTNIVNIPPKCGVDVNIKIYIDDSLDEILKFKKCFLYYNTDKFKEKKVELKRINYKEIPFSRKIENCRYIVLREE